MRDIRPMLRAAARAIGLCVVPSVTLAGRVDVVTLDRDGEPVPEVAVYAVPVDVDATGGARPVTPDVHTDHGAAPPEINQRELAFHPHLLIIETGTSVRFPNDDDVRHHVYSFSAAKRFDLTIDSGSVTSETFDAPGVVTLGCNIHDDMLAYVLVVDTPHFAMTGGEGTVSLTDLAAGRYEIRVWTPRLAEKALPGPVTIEISGTDAQTVAFQFEKKLYPPHEHSETSLHWSHY
jgi:plastocyanin